MHLNAVAALSVFFLPVLTFFMTIIPQNNSMISLLVLGLLASKVSGWRSDVHITLETSPTSMSVSWSTLQPDSVDVPTRSSTVYYGLTPDLDSLTLSSEAQTTIMHTLTEDISTYDYCGNVWETREMNSVKLEGEKDRGAQNLSGQDVLSATR